MIDFVQIHLFPIVGNMQHDIPFPRKKYAVDYLFSLKKTCSFKINYVLT